LEVSRKKMRQEVLERIKYVKTCVMARELCLLVRTNRAVLEPKDVQDVCRHISSLCKEEGCVEPSELCQKAAAAVGSRDEEKYLERKMTELCPNMTAVAGYLIGAKLLAYAGSTKRLAELPSSTIQLLGAEKALFRHITRNSLPPKYGVLHEHPMIARARKQDHGKVARLLADKISIASRVDYFKGAFIGDKLKEEIEKRFPR